MKRSLLLLTSLSVALLAPSAALSKKAPKKTKKPSARALTLKASLSGPAGTDGDYSGIGGKAQLVDNKRNDKVSLHVRGLKPGATYSWSIQTAAAGDSDPCDAGSAGTPVAAFIYKLVNANPGGVLNTKARSRTFKAVPGTTYFVEVRNDQDLVTACGVFKKARGPKKPSPAKKKGSSKRGPSKGKHRAPTRAPSRP